MKIKMVGLYGIESESAYMRKLGLCFDFVNNPNSASEFTAEETKDVIDHKQFYLNMYGAKDLFAVTD